MSVEDANHILRDCVMTNMVWRYFEQRGQGFHEPGSSLYAWMHRNLRLTTRDLAWPTIRYHHMVAVEMEERHMPRPRLDCTT